MSWLARHDPEINLEKRTVVRFGHNATESDDPVSVAHAPQVHPTIPFKRLTLFPPVLKHKSQRLRES
ncbi:hypothetical protein PC121_g9981 [Phytophthora cactorum]|nr:hypothetical protein PC120_g23951 [Phytophthora cactorum]KAG3069004.1 hypothetical protein PC121_g9981 [Phytophthora cactorum]KAG4042687.1 hypothetical protein PC123_g21826 [Phytophthora cactorum]